MDFIVSNPEFAFFTIHIKNSKNVGKSGNLDSLYGRTAHVLNLVMHIDYYKTPFTNLVI